MNKLFCIIGEMGAGKDTIVSNVLDKLKTLNIPIELLKSNTTRPMRVGELQGREYNFTSNKEFYSAYDEDDLLEYASYNTHFGVWHYYTLLSDLKLNTTSQLKIINPLGLSQITCTVPNNQLVVIYITCDKEIRKQRSINRGDDLIEIEDRLKRDEKDFKYLKYNYKLINDGTKSIEELSNNIIKILNDEMEMWLWNQRKKDC